MLIQSVAVRHLEIFERRKAFAQAHFQCRDAFYVISLSQSAVFALCRACLYEYGVSARWPYGQGSSAIDYLLIGDKFGVGFSTVLACKKVNTADADENLFRCLSTTSGASARARARCHNFCSGTNKSHVQTDARARTPSLNGV